MDSIYEQWKADKPLIAGTLLFLVTFSIILVNTIYSYTNMQTVKGKVFSVDVDIQKKTYLTLKLDGDNRIYYQQYENKFFDDEIYRLHKNDEIKFWTFKTPQKKHAAISSVGDKTSFLYYPVFSINKPANILKVFYYYVYDNFILDILFAFSLVLVMYNGFYIFRQLKWIYKVPIGILIIFICWMWIP